MLHWLRQVFARGSESIQPPEERVWKEISQITPLHFGCLFRWFEEEPVGSGVYYLKEGRDRRREAQYRWFLHRGQRVLINGIRLVDDNWTVSVWVEASGQVLTVRMPAPRIPTKFRSRPMARGCLDARV
jgi:hypothetical protein